MEAAYSIRMSYNDDRIVPMSSWKFDANPFGGKLFDSMSYGTWEEIVEDWNKDPNFSQGKAQSV